MGNCPEDVYHLSLSEFSEINQTDNVSELPIGPVVYLKSRVSPWML